MGPYQVWGLTHPPPPARSFLVTQLFSQVTSYRTLCPQRLRGRLCALVRILEGYSSRVLRDGGSGTAHCPWAHYGGRLGTLADPAGLLKAGSAGGSQAERLVGEVDEPWALLLPGVPCVWQEFLGLAWSSLGGLSQWSSWPLWLWAWEGT